MCGNNKDSSVINFLIVSCLSSDNNLDVESCTKNIHELKVIKKSIEESDISDKMKSYWIKYANRGIQACERNKEELENS